MSEATEGGNEGGQTPPAGDGFQPITSQDDLNRVIGERLERERSKFADYDDLKQKASRYDELEEANKTEIEKATEKAAAAEAELSKVPEKVAGALRDHLVKVHEITDEDAELFLTATDPETLLKQVERLAGQTNRKGPRVPREGATTSPTSDPKRTFLRELTGRD